MKWDYSKELYDKYMSLDNHSIEIKLRNGNCMQGIISGYFRDDDCAILQWHITISGANNTATMNDLKSTIIQTKDILTVKFLADDSIIVLDKN
jgi:hypothetical protein